MFLLCHVIMAQDYVGTTAGVFSTSPTGAATYTIPLQLRDGYSAFTPQISLVYNSQSGNGIAGFGWNIAGLSAITAIPHSRYYDGTNIQGISVNSSDVYALDGERLLLKSGANAKKGAEYTTEEEKYLKISIDSAFATTPKSFVVKKPDGSIYKYGSTTNSIYRYNGTSGTSAFAWLLDYAEDKDGNCIKYIYTYYNDVPYLTQIQYGINKSACSSYCSVTFNYAARTDTIVSHVKEKNFYTTRRLTNIVCKYYDTRYRTYGLSYNNTSHYSHLTAVKELGSGTRGYPATTFTWNNLPTINIQSHGTTVEHELYRSPCFNYYASGDVDNDGKAELICVCPRDDDNSMVSILRRENNEFNILNTYTFDSSFIWETSHDWDYFNFVSSGIVGHFRQSQSNMVVVPMFSSENGEGSYAKFRFVEEGWRYSSPLQHTAEMPAYVIADFDKDGVDAILYVEKKRLLDGNIRLVTIKVKNNPQTGNESEQNLDLSSGLTSAQKLKKIKSCLAADFDNDGLTDLLIGCESYSIIFWNINGSFNANNYHVLTNIKHGDTFQLADFNGDGLMDLIINEPGSTTWKKALNNGVRSSSLFSVSNLTALSNKSVKKQSDNDSIYRCIIQDLNVDGLSDLMVSYISGGNQKVCWMRAEWDGTFTTMKEATLSMSNCALSHNIALGDFDGDGFPETVEYGGDINNGGSTFKSWHLYNNDNYSISNHKIATVKDGLGKETKLVYRSLLDSYTNNENVTFPLMKFYAPLAVVDSNRVVWKSTSYSTKYSYDGGIMHVLGKGFLGFQTQTTTDSGWKHVKELDIHLPYYTPYIASETTTNMSDAIINTHSYHYTFTGGDVNKSYYKNLFREDVGDNISYQGKNIYYSNYYYGNPQSIETESAISENTQCVYGQNTQNGKYILGYPLTIETHYTTQAYNEQDDHFYEKAAYSYNAKIQPTKKQIYKSDQASTWNLASTEAYQYDNGGKTIRTSTCAYYNTDSLITTYTYDTYGRLTHKVLPDGHGTAYAYNSLGLLSTETDEWFSTQQTHIYDEMGRPTKTIKKSTVNAFTPDTTSVSYASGGSSFSYKVTTTSSHQPTTIEYYDGFGRNARSGSIHFNGNEYVTDRTYINANVIGFESVPHLSGSSSSTGTAYTYDSFFRPTLVTEPSGKTVKTAYLDTVKEVVENGDTTYYHYDEGGKLTNRYDDKGEINYFYKATGEYDKIQLCYQDEPDVFSTYTYDQYGRLTQLVDPNGDTRGYTYDDNGFLQKFSQGGNRWEKFTYNKYGDVTKKIYRLPNLSQITTNYTYDDKRQLVKILGPNFREEHTYNVSGQLTNKLRSVSVEGKTYRKSTDYAYNGESQVKSMTSTLNGVSFPVVESYNYKRGWTTDIKLNNRQVWHLNSENGQGLISSTSNRLGTTTYTYYNSGLVQNSNTTVFASSTGGNTSFQHSYTYDEYGRIATKDGKQYGYDDYNQLTSWNGRGYSYDQRGNIIMAGGQTELIYQQYKINTIVGPNVNIWGRGNLNITYNGLNKPHTIKLQENNSNVGYETEIRYDAEGNRISAVKTRSVTQGTAITTTNEYVRAYVDSRYEVEDKITDSSSPYQPTRYYYVGGDPLSACAVAAICNNQLTLWQIYHDNQGSITEMADSVNVNRYYYDPWGRYCDASGNMSLSIYAKGGNAGNPFYRGYLGQEHDLKYGVINLNARLYDPFIGRFLSADPVYDSSRSIFGFNPYVYGNNCPSMYVDPDGKFAWIPLLIGAAVGGTFNLAANWNNVNNFWQGLGYFGVGAAAGAASVASPSTAWYINGGVAIANSIIYQGSANGWDNIAWGQVAFDGILSMGIERFMGPLQHNISSWIGNYTSSITRSSLYNGWVNKIFSSSATNGMMEGIISAAEKKPVLNGVKNGVAKGIYKGTLEWSASELPTQKHHFATNKHSEFTPAMENIAKKYGLKLDEDWNIEPMPHLGRHPYAYNNWVLNQMGLIDEMPGMNQQRFLQEFDFRIKQNVINNPEMLRKSWW